MKEVAETAHLYLDNKFAYTGANKISSSFMIDWALFLGDLYKYKRFKITLNSFMGFTAAARTAGFDTRATVRLKGLPWCDGNSCGTIYPASEKNKNGTIMTYSNNEAVIPSFIVLPEASTSYSVFSETKGLCFHRPPPGSRELFIEFQELRNDAINPAFETTTDAPYCISFTIIPLED